MEGELTLRLSKKDINAIVDQVCERMLPALRLLEPPANPEDLITAKEVQELLRIKASAFYDWRKKQDFPRGYRVGPKAMRWRRADILNFAKKEAP